MSQEEERSQGISPSLAPPLQQQIRLLYGLSSLKTALAPGSNSLNGSGPWSHHLLLMLLQPSGYSLSIPHLPSQLPHHPLASSVN